MAPEHFTKIGDQIGDLNWLLLVIGLLALAVSFSRKNRWFGGLAALSSIVAALFHIPAPFCFVLILISFTVGGIADMALRHTDRAPTIRYCILVVLGNVAISAFLVMSEQSKDIALASDGLQATARYHRPLSADRKDINGVELIDRDGNPLEWRFTKPKDGSKRAFLANILYNELYWDHAGHILTGRQVAAKVADSATINFHREQFAGTG